MTSTFLVVLAAAGLTTAQAPATTATRSAQALPAKTAALVQTAPKAQAGCFVPVKDGKLGAIKDVRKGKATTGCANPALASATNGGTSGTGNGRLGTGAGIGIGAAVGAGVGFAAGRNGRVNPPPRSVSSF
jgi:hypothetical protein